MTIDYEHKINLYVMHYKLAGIHICVFNALCTLLNCSIVSCHLSDIQCKCELWQLLTYVLYVVPYLLPLPCPISNGRSSWCSMFV